MPTHPKTPGPHEQELRTEFLVAELAKFRSPPFPTPKAGGEAFIEAGGTPGAIKRSRADLADILREMAETPTNSVETDEERAVVLLEALRNRRARLAKRCK